MTVKFVVKPLMKGAADGEWLFYVYLDVGWVSATSEMFATRELAEQAAKTIIEDARQGQLMFELNYGKQKSNYCARIMDRETRAYLAKTGLYDTPDGVQAMLRRLYEQCRVTGDDEPAIVV